MATSPRGICSARKINGNNSKNTRAHTLAGLDSGGGCEGGGTINNAAVAVAAGAADAV